MVLKSSDFKRVTIDDKKIFDSYLRRFPQKHSDASFITIITWDSYSPCSYAEADDHLIFRSEKNGRMTYYSPIGRYSPELLEEVLALAKEDGNKIALYFLDDTYLEYMENNRPETPVYLSNAFREYYYKTSELANLSGRKYLNIRGQINKFNSQYKYKTEPISSSNLSEVREMVEEWCAVKHCENNEFMREEANAVKKALELWDSLDCDGLVIRIIPENKIAAISVWEGISRDTAIIHFEKGFASYKGIYKIVNLETAKALENKYIWINRESDVDVPGLREAKLRYHPECFAELRYIKKSEIV